MRCISRAAYDRLRLPTRRSPRSWWPSTNSTPRGGCAVRKRRANPGGRRAPADGGDEVRKLLENILAALRFSKHRVTAQWQQEEVWIAEVEATFELRDWLALKVLPRAFVLRNGTRWDHRSAHLRVARALVRQPRQPRGGHVDRRTLGRLSVRRCPRRFGEPRSGRQHQITMVRLCDDSGC